MLGSARPTLWTRLAPLALLAASVGALAAALAAQHVFGLEPCVLCFYERVPYAIAGLLAAAALVLPVRRTVRLGMVGGCAAVFLAGAALGFYHVGVEQHWWGSIAGCGGEPPANLTVENLQAEIAREPSRPCDRVDWRLFGLSLACYNVLASLALSAVSLALWRLLTRTDRP